MEYRTKVLRMLEEINQIILGKEDLINQVMAAFLADGHVLLEDVPGVGKTTLTLAFSKAMELDCHRLQFTPDVLPSDLTGFSMYRKDTDSFVYQEGSVFCNLLLVDEINRASPKTQSALLEVMEERQVSVEGVTRKVPSPFLVIATQNPFGSAGTQMLPLAQMDRFMISTTMGYPDFENEVYMAKGLDSSAKIALLEPMLSISDFLNIKKEVEQVYIKDTIYEYIVDLISMTRKYPFIEEGASPRGTIALVKMAKAACWLEGKEFVSPDDIAKIFKAVVYHRISLNTKAQMENMDKNAVIESILYSVEQPKFWE